MRGWEPVDPAVLAAALLPTDELDGPESLAARAEDVERLRAALATLPDDHRRALVLAAYLGRTAREISELEGAPLGTIKTRIRTAMMRVRERLEVTD